MTRSKISRLGDQDGRRTESFSDRVQEPGIAIVDVTGDPAYSSASASGFHRSIGIGGQVTSTIKAISNSSAVVVAQIINKASMYVAFLFASLALPLYDFGLYTLVLALKEILNAVATFGLDQVLIRMLAQVGSLEARKRLLRDSVELKLFSSVIAGGILLDAMLWLGVSNDLVLGTTIMMADLILANVWASLSSYYQARLLSTAPTLLQAVARAAYLVGLVVASLSGASWLILLEILLLSDALMCLLLAWRLGKHLGPVVAVPLPYRTQMFFEAIPLGIASIGVLLYTRIDTVLIAHLRSVTEVAFYSAAYKLTESPLVVMTGISATVLPLVSSWNPLRTSGQQIYEVAGRSLRYTYSLSLIAAVTVTFFGREFITLLYGNRYAEIGPAVAVLIWGMVAMASNSVTAAIYTAMKRQRLLMVIVSANILVNLAVNLWAIPHWGYFGSALATTATEGFNMAIQITVLCWLVRRLRLAYTTILAIIVGSVSTAVYFMANEHPSLLMGGEALMALVIVLLAFRLVRRDDVHRVRLAFKRVFSRRRRQLMGTRQ